MHRGRHPSNESTALGGDPTPGQRIGDYEVLHPVARGGMASVLAVRDTRNNSVRALKLLLPMTHADEAQSRFRREFRALSRMQHPNVLRVFEWGLLGARPWFTMELLEGETLKDAAADWASLEPDDRFARARQVLTQVARALSYIHDRGLVHRDVTPSNIMVLPDGSAKIMDFGVVKDMGAELTAVGEVVGTVAYISPEQIVGDSIDARADLYSLGAVLYLMLTGSRPFQARTLQGYLEKHLHETPRPPSELQPLVPADLADICMRLLQKDPSARYASAHHLLHLLSDDSEGVLDDERWPPSSVGRTMVKARLRESLDDISHHKKGAALLLSGAPGMGKTRLLDLAEAYARRRGLRVARGRCRPQDRPFGAFVGVYRALADDTVPPVLREALSGEQPDDGVVRERYPVIAAFRELLLAHAPCVVILDDLESADAATVELVEYLVRNTLELASEPVVFLLGQEAPVGFDTVVGRQLARLEVTLRLDLLPLDSSEVEELVVSLLGTEPGAIRLARRLHDVSEGNPAYLADMLRGLVDEGIIQEQAGRFTLTLGPAEITRSRLPMPASLRQALRDRLTPLTRDGLAVGRVLAASRNRLDLDTLIEASQLNEDRVMDGLDALTSAQLTHEEHRGDTEFVELAENRIREVFLEGLASEERRALHQRLGEALERQYRLQPSVVVEELAWQFEQARLAPKAYAYLALTARRHLNRSLYEEALGFLDRALRMEPTARPLMLLDHADRELSEVYLAHSQVLYHLGNWTSALEDAQRAAGLASDVRDPVLQSRVAAELGNQLRNQGNNYRAEHHLREALGHAEAAGDPSLQTMPLYQLGGVRWGQGDLAEAEELWARALEIAQRTGDERAMGYGYNGLGILAFCRGNSAEARTQLERSAQVFERLGMLAPLSISRVNLAEIYLSTGILRKALELAERTVSQAQEVHLPHGMALGLVNRAQVLNWLGRGDEALQNAREALKLVRQLGTHEDEVLALVTLVRVDLDRGAPDRSLVRLDELMPLLAEFDTEGFTPYVNAMRVQALARVGRRDEALDCFEYNVDDQRAWPHVQVRTALARGLAWLLLDEPERAVPMLIQALETSQHNGYRFFQLVAHHKLVLTLAALPDTSPLADPSELARHSRVAVALARSLAANLPMADRRRFLSREWGRIPTRDDS